MTLPESYKAIKTAIVAFAPKYIPVRDESIPPPKYPPIIGTGFVVTSDGLIATNDHVVKSFKLLSKPPDAPPEEWPVEVFFWKLMPAGLFEIRLEVLGVADIAGFVPPEHYMGPKKPDVAYVYVKAKGLPAVQLDAASPLSEGVEVATAGFPFGTRVLTAPGWLHQVSPTLQRGIISAVLPFTCPIPHAFAVNVMGHGGASGSPVFLSDSGKVIGVLYGRLVDVLETEKKEQYEMPTNISYVVPSHYLVNTMKVLARDPQIKLPADAKSIEEIIKTSPVINALAEGIQWEVRRTKKNAGVRRCLTQVTFVSPESEIP